MIKNIQPNISKKDQLKYITLFVVLSLIITTSIKGYSYLQKRNIENAKVKVVKGLSYDDPLKEYRDLPFDYNPNFNDFFEVEDEITDGVVYKITEGEIKIRNNLGGIMYRALPRLIQKVALPAVYKTLIEDSNPNKGKVYWVSGKVLSINSTPKRDEILSAQFSNLYLIETVDGGVFELQSIREAKEIRVGDIIYMNGVYLKLKKLKSDNKVVPILLGNSIQILLPAPAIWEDKEIYTKHLKAIKDRNKVIIDMPKEIDLSVYETKFEDDLKNNDSDWLKINDKKEEESQKLVPELELKMIKDLSNVSNNVLLDLIDPSTKLDQLVLENETKRRKIVKIVGKLETISEASLAEPINGLEKVYYSKVKDLKGNYYYFSFLTPKFIDQEDRLLWKDPSGLIPKEGDIVICTGVFVQLVKEGEERIPLVYGKLMADLNEYRAIWDPVDNGGNRTAGNEWGGKTFLDAGHIEKNAFSYLLAKLSYTNSKSIVNTFISTPMADRINFVKMMTKPDLIMDSPFVRFGVMKKITKIEGALHYDFHGVKDVYEIYFIDEDSNLFTFISLNLPTGAELNKRMTFAGYFLKRTAFRNADGNITWTPYVVGYIDSVEVEKIKVMSVNEKIALAIILVFSFIFIAYMNFKYFFPDKKVNKMRKDSIQNAKTNRENLRQLTASDKKLNEILITHFHHSLVEEMPIPIELCLNVSHWPKSEEGKTNTLLRPEYLKSEYDAIIRHLSEFKTDVPKDIKAAFFNKRKELLGLRAFQASKFEIPEQEKKRPDCFLVVPLDFIVNRPENLERMDEYLDVNGLPPYHTWMQIGKIPRFILRNSTTGYTPETIALICFLPSWMVERAKLHFRVVVKEKRAKDENEEEEKT